MAGMHRKDHDPHDTAPFQWTGDNPKPPTGTVDISDAIRTHEQLTLADLRARACNGTKCGGLSLTVEEVRKAMFSAIDEWLHGYGYGIGALTKKRGKR